MSQALTDFFVVRCRPTAETWRAIGLVASLIVLLGSMLTFVLPRFGYALAGGLITLFYLIIYFATLFFVRGRGTFAEVGITRHRWLMAAFLGSVVGGATLVGTITSFPGGGFLIPPWRSLLALLFTGLSVGFIEALVFYGYLQFQLEEAFGPPVAVLGSALAWTLFHAVTLAAPGAGTFGAEVVGVTALLIYLFVIFLVIALIVHFTRNIWAGVVQNAVTGNVLTNLYLLSVMPDKILIGDPNSLPAATLVALLVVTGLLMSQRRGPRATAHCALALLLLSIPVSCAASPEPPLRIFYQGRETLVMRRLQLDPSTQVVEQLKAAQTAVYQGELPPPGPQLDALKARVESGMGLLVVLGRKVSPDSLSALTGGAIQQTGVVDPALSPRHTVAAEKIAATIEYCGPRSDPLSSEVSWKASVRIHDRSLLKTGGNATVLVETTKSDPIRPSTPIVVRAKLGVGTIYVLNVWLEQGDLDAREHSYRLMLLGAQQTRNYDFQRFFFFNYLLYWLTRDAAGIAPVRFGRWVAAPVPGARTTAILSSLLTSMLAALVFGFVLARRYSTRHPEEREHFYRARPAAPVASSLGAAAAAPQADQAEGAPHSDPRWEVIGFHRPLSGFLFNYLLNVTFLMPFNFVTTFWLDRTFVNPFLEARGAGAAVYQLTLFLVPLLDLGTSQSTVKYFSEYRIKEPGRAIGYVQFFVWFHLLLGLLALGALALIGAAILPNTGAGYMSWFVVLYTMALFPPFFQTFLHIFRAYQRFDYAQLVIVLYFGLNPLVQMACAVYGRHWGLIHPAFGEGMGAAMGFAAGGVLGHFLLGLICTIFYHRSGMRLLTIVLAHFDADTVKKSLIYGAKATAGTVMPFLSWGLVPVILGGLLPNFLELNEIWLLTFTLTFGYLETGVAIFANMMPSVSEAYSHDMRALTQRYADQGLRWGLIVTTMLGGVYVAFSPVIIKGLLPPQFARALGVMALMHLFRMFEFTTRMPDQFFMGAARTGTFSLTVAVEHIGRILLSWYLIKWLGFAGLFYAFALSAALKSLLAWTLMSKLVIKPVFSAWQTFVNPGVTAICSYVILRTLIALMWRGPDHLANTWLVVMACLLGSFPVYMSISGLLGWDDAEMAEFKDAADLVPAPFRRLARIGYGVVSIATRLSPLHERFPAKLAEGVKEAAILTASKAKLH